MILKTGSESIAKAGVNALDLIPGNPISEKTLTFAKRVLQQNFGIEYAEDKWLLLVDMMDEEGWTEERFQRTFKWFLKNKRFPAWTVADWFDYGVKLYPYTWYVEQIHKNGRSVNSSIEVYEVAPGLFGYKYIDGEVLPFRRVEASEKPQKENVNETSSAVT